MRTARRWRPCLTPPSTYLSYWIDSGAKEKKIASRSVPRGCAGMFSMHTHRGRSRGPHPVPARLPERYDGEPLRHLSPSSVGVEIGHALEPSGLQPNASGRIEPTPTSATLINLSGTNSHARST
jgi:hypothetical protein